MSGTTETVVAQYVWGQYIDELIQQKQPAVSGAPVFYLFSDLLYRSVALTNGSGTIVEAYDTDAYGNTVCYSGPGADGIWFTNDDTTTNSPLNCYIFTGRQYDPEMQIYFYRARYYSPTLGRLIGRDQIMGDGDGPNLYQYVRGNPIIGKDPSGLLGIGDLPGIPFINPIDVAKQYAKQKAQELLEAAEEYAKQQAAALAQAAKDKVTGAAVKCAAAVVLPFNAPRQPLRTYTCICTCNGVPITATYTASQKVPCALKNHQRPCQIACTVYCQSGVPFASEYDTLMLFACPPTL